MTNPAAPLFQRQYSRPVMVGGGRDEGLSSVRALGSQSANASFNRGIMMQPRNSVYHKMVKLAPIHLNQCKI